MTRSLTVWWDGVVAGSLALDRHGAMRFAYDGAWVADPDRPPVSFSLPKRPESYSTRPCTPFFEGLLPEGTQRDAVAAALGVSSANTFRLLAGLGEEVAGALTLYDPPHAPTLAPLYDLTCTVAYPHLAATLAMRIGRGGTLEEFHPGTWDRFARDCGLSGPFVRRRVRDLCDLARERCEGVAAELVRPGLDEEALHGYAARIAERAGRLAGTTQQETPAR